MTEEELKIIERCGRRLMTADQVAVILDMPYSMISERLAQNEDPVYRAYNKGLLLAELEVRESIIQMANREAARRRSSG